MAWTEVAERKSGVAVREPVMISLQPSRGRLHAVIGLDASAFTLDGFFWRPQAGVRIFLGRDAENGMLRFVPGGQFRVYCPPRRSDVLQLQFSLPADYVAPCRKRAIEYDYDRDWLEVTLPGFERVARRTEPFRTAATKPDFVRPKAGGR